MRHLELAAALERLADDVSLLKGSGDRFFIKRHKLERRARELALKAAELDPERRRRSFQTGIIVVQSRIIPVRVRRSRLRNEMFSRACQV